MPDEGPDRTETSQEIRSFVLAGRLSELSRSRSTLTILLFLLLLLTCETHHSRCSTKKTTKVSRVVNYKLSNIIQILSHCATISHTKNSYTFILQYVVPFLFTFNLVILGAFGTYPFRSLIPAVSISIRNSIRISNQRGRLFGNRTNKIPVFNTVCIAICMMCMVLADRCDCACGPIPPLQFLLMSSKAYKNPEIYEALSCPLGVR